jgi:hypothetical protein
MYRRTTSRRARGRTDGATVQGNVFRWQTQATDQLSPPGYRSGLGRWPAASGDLGTLGSRSADMFWETRDSGAGVTLWGRRGDGQVRRRCDGGKILTSADGLTWSRGVADQSDTRGVTHGQDGLSPWAAAYC